MINRKLTTPLAAWSRRRHILLRFANPSYTEDHNIGTRAVDKLDTEDYGVRIFGSSQRACNIPNPVRAMPAFFTPKPIKPSSQCRQLTAVKAAPTYFPLPAHHKLSFLLIAPF
jgi:hypothetical protein